MTTKRILVVDDDHELLEITRELLELDGHHVRVQSSLFGTTKTVLEFNPDLILLDVNMPGLSGDRLATLLIRGEEGTRRRVVLYSSNDELSLHRAAREVGAEGFVAKGDGATLRRRVRELLET